MIGKKTRRVSLKDVAEKAGVSISLVSFVLNGKSKQYRVGAEISKKIEEIAKEMNYSPNMVAKGLRSGHSYTIGFIMPNLASPFFAALSRHIEDAAGEHGFSVMIRSTDEDEAKTNRIIDIMKSRGIDGFIMAPSTNSQSQIEELLSDGMPTIMIDRYFSDLDIMTITLDNQHAAYCATKGLIERGYKNILNITYSTELEHINVREIGYRQAITEAGLEARVEKVNYSKIEKEVPEVLSKALSAKTAPDAILFSTTMVCINGLRYLKNSHYKIPKDVAVLSFDNGDPYDLYNTQISYVKQPIKEFAKVAVDTLITAITSNKPLSATDSQQLKHQIIWRESTSPISK